MNLAVHPLDTTIDRHIDAATELFEQDTDRVVIEQSFDMLRNRFPLGNRNIDFSLKPIQSIASIKYLDVDGNEQTLDPTTYKYDAGRRHVYLTAESAWPTVYPEQNAVTVSAVCGYGANPSDVPWEIKEAILLLVQARFYPHEAEMYLKHYQFSVERLLRSSYP